jgi:hypothetical protein
VRRTRVLTVLALATGVAASACSTGRATGASHRDGSTTTPGAIRVIDDTSVPVTAVECGPVGQYVHGHPCGSLTAKQIATQHLAVGRSADFASAPSSAVGSAPDYVVVEAAGQPTRCLALPPDSSHNFEIQVSRLTHAGC